MSAKLYCFGESGNAYKAALTLTLAEMEWQAKFVDYFNGATRTPEFRALNEMGEVPVLIIGCYEGRPDQPAPFAQAGLYGSILPAAWSLMLALRARGLGAAWTTLHLRYEREIAELLGLPDHLTQAVLLPVAYYTGEDFQPARRQPLSEVLHWNGWEG